MTKLELLQKELDIIKSLRLIHKTTQARLIVEYQNEMYLLDGEDNPEVEDEL